MNGDVKKAAVPTKRQSQASASPNPAPTAGPLTAAIEGVRMVRSCTGSSHVQRMKSSDALASPIASKAEQPSRSAPPQNAGPCPVMTMTWTSGSSSSSATAEGSRWHSRSSSRAFIRSGRFRRTTATCSGRRSTMSLSTLPPRVLGPTTPDTGLDRGRSVREGVAPELLLTDLPVEEVELAPREAPPLVGAHHQVVVHPDEVDKGAVGVDPGLA